MQIPRGSRSPSLLGKLKSAVFGRPICLGREMEEDSLIRLGRLDSLTRDGRFTFFNLEALRNATSNFHDDNKLRDGGFIPLYKGTLIDGREIAVKKFPLRFHQGMEIFLNQVKLVAELQQENLVHIFGCCVEGFEVLIVYEFVPNKSLDKFLFDSLLSRQLDWETRFNIILGIARALVYLHENSGQPIIHGDIKASNILLDERMNPKVADFGFAMFAAEDYRDVSTTVLKGIMEYMAPEYRTQGQLSVKTDVYSFGVLLLEIICGRKNIDFKLYSENSPLIELVWRSFERGHAVEVIDTKLVPECGEEEAVRCIHVGLLCTQVDASLRPTMSSVYSMLSNPAMTNLPHPTNPNFVNYWESRSISGNYYESEIISSMDTEEEVVSVNYCESEIISINDIEEERQVTHKPLSLATTSNLTDTEIIEMKRYCNHSYKIGEGSFGKVYRGKFRGHDVAIKKIKCTSKDSRTSVENEVRLLHGKDHKNMVGLIAWSIEERAFYLMYEYVKGYTLQKYLRENSQGPFLGWKQCLKIIQGIAEGIQFLHNHQIIHVDIKPENLMLDSADENIKIIDFGFSRHVNWEGTHKSTDRIIGTRGYWAPEYCLNHKLSYKHDVYSFGIVVLEVITGQKHVDNSRGSSQFHIPEHVKYMMGKNRFEQAVDERIKHHSWDGDDVKSAMAVAELALRCADKDSEKRPHMDFVVRSLNRVPIDNSGQKATTSSSVTSSAGKSTKDGSVRL